MLWFLSRKALCAAGSEAGLHGAWVLLGCGRLCRGLGGRGETDFRHPHPPGLVHRVHAAAAACGQLFGREEQPALGRALHPAEGAVGGGGMGHAIVDGVSRPAGKILRQRVLLAPLLKEIAAILGAGQVASHPVGQVSGHFPLLGPQGNGKQVRDR